MSDGQLAMNTNLVSPGLFLKDSNGDLVKVGPVHVGTTAPNATPGAGGQAGNSKGEQWLDTSSSRYVFKIWDGTAWRTEDGEFVNSSGDTMTGALVMDNQQQVRFRETTANGTNFIAIQAPSSVAADRTLTLPDVTGTIVSTGDTGSVTSTMILDGTILNADINASAAIDGTKVAPNFGSQTITTTGVISPALGTAALPSVAFTGDTNTGIYSPGADQVALATNGSRKVLVDATGRLGLATDSPQRLLHVAGGVSDNCILATSIAGNAFIGFADVGTTDQTGLSVRLGCSSNSLVFQTGGTTERARIDSSGRLLVGTSSAVSVNGTTAGLELHALATTNGASASIARFNNDASGPQFNFGKSRSGTLSPGTVVQSNDNLGEISFCADDGTDINSRAASIAALVDGTPGANDMPGRLVFSTTADGESSPTEAMRITNDRVIAYNQPTPTSKSAAATLTITELKTGIIQYTGAVATLTLPTGTLMEGGFSGIYTNMAFEWSVINTGTGICTIGAGTAHTIVGSATVAIGASARFVSRRTASNTFVSYCLS